MIPTFFRNAFFDWERSRYFVPIQLLSHTPQRDCGDHSRHQGQHFLTPVAMPGREGAFLAVRRNKTDFRANLDLERPLSSIVAIKMNKPASLLRCHQFKPGTELKKQLF